MANEFKDKVLKFVEGYKEKRPCNSCGQYLHHSQLDAVDATDVEKIVASVSDKETLEKSKLKVAQLKFICANCDRLRKFKAIS